MKKILFFFILNLFAFSFSQKQPDLSRFKNINDKLKAWDEYCTDLHINEKYKILINKAEYGIQLAKNNPKYLARFYFYKGYGYEYTDNQYEKATIYFEKSLKLAQQAKDLKQETSSLMRLNYMYYSIKEHQKAKNLIKYIKKVVDTVKDDDIKATMLGSLGEYYLDRSEFENFINYKLKAIDYLKLDKKADSLKINNIGVSYLQIADAYNDMKQYEKTIEYCNYAVPYLNKSDGVAFLYNSYIEAYAHLGNIDLAKKYYLKLYDIAIHNPILFLNISYGNRNMAEFYLNKNRLELADDYADKALHFAVKSNDEEIEMEANVIKGKVLLAQEKYKPAIDRLNQALKFAYVYDKRSFADVNKKLSEAYAALNDWKKAYEYHNAYTQTNDSLFIESGKQTLANTEAKYQNKTKQQEIKSLSAENTIHELSIKNAKKQRIYLISGLIAIAIIGGLLYNQSRNRKRINKKLSFLNSELEKANKTKMQFFGILNHDLRSPVVSLIHFLDLQKNSPELIDNETKIRLEKQTSDSAEQLLTQMEDLLLWSKGQMENFEPHKQFYYINEIFNEIEKEFVWASNVDIEFEIPTNLKIFTDKEYLKTIIRNLMSNAVKVLQNASDPKILCKVWDQSDFQYILIKDNGGGTNIEEFRALYDDKISIGTTKGLGMHVIRDLCKAIDCKIEVDSDKEIGETTITLSIRKA
ncbi:ATP-binding protein [Epilithonimonas sp. JDS]|uniref:tetratricopeptide repeat-containing sensor histidine kinase n=1 Tax=Epilithonimonas sp. JDS TaxID=2902797 RepID=UPI001E293342|nr:HAMP domain-containing sensor histidine kinase [Epilithonimonas sp. JDS]MCD9853723.1 ATP-binding protein [Epilithonimonas sp. JDS]